MPQSFHCVAGIVSLPCLKVSIVLQVLLACLLCGAVAVPMAELRSCDAGSTPIGGSRQSPHTTTSCSNSGSGGATITTTAPTTNTIATNSNSGCRSSKASNIATVSGGSRNKLSWRGVANTSGPVPPSTRNSARENTTHTRKNSEQQKQSTVIASGSTSINSNIISNTRTRTNSSSSSSSGVTKNSALAVSCNSNINADVNSDSTVVSSTETGRSLASTVAPSSLPLRKRKYSALDFSVVDRSVKTNSSTSGGGGSSSGGGSFSSVSAVSLIPSTSTTQAAASSCSDSGFNNSESIISSPVTRKQAAARAAASTVFVANSSNIISVRNPAPQQSKSQKHSRLSLPAYAKIAQPTPSKSLKKQQQQSPTRQPSRVTRRSLLATPSAPITTPSKASVSTTKSTTSQSSTSIKKTASVEATTTRRKSLRGSSRVAVSSPNTVAGTSLAAAVIATAPSRRLTRQSSQSGLLGCDLLQFPASPAAQPVHVGTKRRRFASGKSTSSIESVSHY